MHVHFLLPLHKPHLTSPHSSPIYTSYPETYHLKSIILWLQAFHTQGWNASKLFLRHSINANFQQQGKKKKKQPNNTAHP